MKTYNYKYILLALREEYLKLNEKLDELKELSIVYGADEYYYNLHKIPYSKELPELTVDKIVKEYDPRTFGALMYQLFGEIKPTRTIMLRDNNGNYFPQRVSGNGSVKKNDFAIFPRHETSQEFSELANEILTSDVAKNINFTHTIKAVKDCEIPNAKIYPSIYGMVLHTPKQRLDYIGRQDMMKIAGYQSDFGYFEKLTPEYFSDIVNLEFPVNEFSDYHKEIIESYIDKTAQLPYISLEGCFTPSTYGKYILDDSTDNVYLRRKK